MHLFTTLDSHPAGHYTLNYMIRLDAMLTSLEIKLLVSVFRRGRLFKAMLKCLQPTAWSRHDRGDHKAQIQPHKEYMYIQGVSVIVQPLSALCHQQSVRTACMVCVKTVLALWTVVGNGRHLSVYGYVTLSALLLQLSTAVQLGIASACFCS